MSAPPPSSAPSDNIDKAGFIASLYATFSKIQSGGYGECAGTICLAQVGIARASGGVSMTIQVVDVNTGLPVNGGWGQPWFFPGPR